MVGLVKHMVMPMDYAINIFKFPQNGMFDPLWRPIAMDRHYPKFPGFDQLLFM